MCCTWGGECRGCRIFKGGRGRPSLRLAMSLKRFMISMETVNVPRFITLLEWVCIVTSMYIVLTLVDFTVSRNYEIISIDRQKKNFIKGKKENKPTLN